MPILNRRVRPSIAIAVISVVAVAAVGCGSGSQSSPTSTSSGERPTTVPEGPRNPVIAAVVLTAEDVGPDAEVEMMEGGDQVAGMVTLDVCGGDFPSEADRTDRYQQNASQGTTPLWSNETVLYRTSEDAAAALDEVRAAIADCPADQYVSSPVMGEPDATFAFTPVPEAATASLAPDHVATTADVTYEGEGPIRVTVVYQRRGRVLAMVYGNDEATTLDASAVVAERLAALTPEQAGEG